MEFAEQYAAPTEAYLGPLYPRRNEFQELFYLRWGRIRFRVEWGGEMNVKVVLKVFHEDGTFEQYLAHTDPSGASGTGIGARRATSSSIRNRCTRGASPA